MPVTGTGRRGWVGPLTAHSRLFLQFFSWYAVCLLLGMNNITRLGVVGGVERAFRHLLDRSLCRDVRVEFHAGHMNGSGERELSSLVQRCDVVIVVTGVNSHNAVRRTRELTRLYQRPCFIVRRLGTQLFSEILDTLPSSRTEDTKHSYAPFRSSVHDSQRSPRVSC